MKKEIPLDTFLSRHEFNEFPSVLVEAHLARVFTATKELRPPERSSLVF